LDTDCGVSVGSFSEYHLLMGKNEKTRPSRPYWADVAKRLMREQGVTQEDLTETLGVDTRGAVGHYMTGRRDLTLVQFVKLSRRLGVSVSQLVGEAPITGDKSDRSEILRLLDSIEESDLPILLAVLKATAQRKT
jgi:transcriptional regulator with XRE-family HTH domain